jgi:hypothetical protein
MTPVDAPGRTSQDTDSNASTNMKKTLPRSLLAIVALAALIGCSKGVDQPLVTSKGLEAYRASLAEAVRDMDKRQTDAFDWAVSDLSVEKIDARYPNGSPRKIIRGEVDAVLKEAPARIAELEKKSADWNAVAEEIAKVGASGVSFALGKDFFGLQPAIRATVTNGSRHGYSTLYWYAELYLDGASEPAARTELIDLYKDEGGLKPGEQRTREFRVGFVSGDAAWKTLEIQNAGQRVVKLVVMPERAKDFGDRWIAGPSPQKELAGWKSTLETARRIQAEL